MSYDIKTHPQVERFLKKCNPALHKRIKNRLLLLREDPFRYLEHYEGKDYYKFRIGEYRVLIDVDTTRKIVFVRVLDHRKKIYKLLT